MNDTNKKRRKRNDENKHYRYDKFHSEEMSENDINTLAMCVATYIYEQLQIEAIAEMQCISPDFNPLTGLEIPKGESSKTNEAKHLYDYHADCKIHFKKIPGIFTAIEEVSFTVTPALFNEGDSNE